MDGETIIWIVAIVSIFVLPRLLKHKLELAKIRSGQPTLSNGHAAEVDALRKRCDALEKRCEELQLQVTDAHSQLADERRELDLRLASMLPPAGDVPA